MKSKLEVRDTHEQEFRCGDVRRVYSTSFGRVMQDTIDLKGNLGGEASFTRDAAETLLEDLAKVLAGPAPAPAADKEPA